MKDKEQTISSEISEIKDAVKSQNHKIDRITEKINDEIKHARDEFSNHIKEGLMEIGDKHEKAISKARQEDSKYK